MSNIVNTGNIISYIDNDFQIQGDNGSTRGRVIYKFTLPPNNGNGGGGVIKINASNSNGDSDTSSSEEWVFSFWQRIFPPGATSPAIRVFSNNNYLNDTVYDVSLFKVDDLMQFTIYCVANALTYDTYYGSVMIDFTFSEEIFFDSKQTDTINVV